MASLHSRHIVSVVGLTLLATAAAHSQTRRPVATPTPAPTFVRPSVGGQDVTTHATKGAATLRCLEQWGAGETVHKLVAATSGDAGLVCEYVVDKARWGVGCGAGWTLLKDFAGQLDICQHPDKSTKAATCPAGYEKNIQPDVDGCWRPDGLTRVYTLGACTRSPPPYAYAPATCPSHKLQPSEEDRVARAVRCPAGWSLVREGVQSAYCEKKAAAPR